MKILITGATGFLGSHLLHQLLKVPGKHQVTVLKRSFSDVSRINSQLRSVDIFNLDQVSLSDIFCGAAYDVIMHCATNYGRQEVERSEMLETNLLLPLRLLEMGVAHGVRHFVNTDTLLDKRVSPYALSKRQFREWLQHFGVTINAITVTLEHFYGPQDDATKFVTFIIQSLLRGVPAIPLTPGEQLRDFIYIDDVVSAFMYILDSVGNKNNGYTEYEVGSGCSVSIRDFVTKVKYLCLNQDTILNFGAIPYRPNESMNIQVNSLALRALGWQPLVNIDQGLRKTIETEKKSIK